MDREETRPSDEVEVIQLCKRGCCPILMKMKDGILFAEESYTTGTTRGIFLSWEEIEELKKLIREGKL